MDAVSAFITAAACTILCLYYIGEKITEVDLYYFLPRNRKRAKLKRLRAKRATPLHGMGLHKEIKNSFEKVLIPLGKSDLRLLPSRMDMNFRKQIEPHVWRLDQKGHFVVGKEEFAPVKQVETTAETVEKYGTLMLCDAPFRDIKLYTRGGSLWEIGLLPSPPVLALWGEPQGEDGYICVEPWWGLNDFADRERELTKKQGLNMLLPGNSAHYHAMFKKVR